MAIAFVHVLRCMCAPVGKNSSAGCCEGIQGKLQIKSNNVNVHT